MPKFQIINGPAIIEICIDSSPFKGRQRKVQLEVSDWGGTQPPKIDTDGDFVRVGGVSHDAGRRRSKFWIEPPYGAKGIGFVFADHNLLRVTVGKVENQKDMSCDLIADLGRSEDPRTLRIYQRILAARNNNIATPDWDANLADQPLKQLTANESVYDCGQANNRLGQILKENYKDGHDHYKGGELRYYKPLKPKPVGKIFDQVGDLQFDADTVRKGAETIAKRLLDDKTATVVFATHGDPTHGGEFGSANGTITHPGTHFVTFVGCSADKRKFLITDPWPSGSNCKYESGIFGDIQSKFMGTMAYSELEHVIKTTDRMGGTHDYRVIKSP